MKRIRDIAAIAALAVGGYLAYQHFTSDDGTSAATVAARAGAESCAATPYGLKNRVDGTTARIYDCTSGGVRRCVTYENGVATDQTAAVRVVYATALGGARPSCL